MLARALLQVEVGEGGRQGLGPAAGERLVGLYCLVLFKDVSPEGRVGVCRVPASCGADDRAAADLLAAVMNIPPAAAATAPAGRSTVRSEA